MRIVTSRLLPLVLGILVLAGVACIDSPTRPPAYNPFPQQLFSPSADSHYVYFRDDGTAFDRPAGIYRVPIEGGAEPEPVILHQDVYFPNIREDGALLAFVAIFQALLTRDMEDGSERNLFEEYVVGIDWYGRDTLVCEIFNGGLYVVNVDSAKAELIDGLEGSYPIGSSVNGLIAYFRYRPDIFGDTTELWVSTIGGESATLIERFTQEFLSYADWSPDGRRIVIERNTAREPRIAILNFASRQTSDSLVMFASNPRFTGDGGIVYVQLGDKYRDQRDEIWIMESDGGNKRKVL